MYTWQIILIIFIRIFHRVDLQRSRKSEEKRMVIFGGENGTIREKSDFDLNEPFPINLTVLKIFCGSFVMSHYSPLAAETSPKFKSFIISLGYEINTEALVWYC